MKKRTARRKSGKKNNLHRYRYIIVVILFFISLTFLAFYGLNQYFNQSFASAYSEESIPITEDSFFSILFIEVNDFNSDPVLALKASLNVFDKNTKKVFIYNIPIEEKVDVIGKYGEESLSKVFVLASLDSQDYLASGLSMFENTIFTVTALKPDKYILVEKEASHLFDDYWDKGEAINLWNVGNISLIKNSVKTNMDIKDYSTTGKFIRSLPEDRIMFKEMDLSNSHYMDKFDEDIRDITFETKLSTDSRSISILNGTKEAGLANFGARAVRNLGGRVVAISNAQKVYDQSVIISDLSKEDITIRLISKIFDIQNILNKSDAVYYSESEVNRSDIVVIMGIDKENYLY